MLKRLELSVSAVRTILRAYILLIIASHLCCEAKKLYRTRINRLLISQPGCSLEVRLPLLWIYDAVLQVGQQTDRMTAAMQGMGAQAPIEPHHVFDPKRPGASFVAVSSKLGQLLFFLFEGRATDMPGFGAYCAVLAATFPPPPPLRTTVL
jgi:hypothetical protein